MKSLIRYFVNYPVLVNAILLVVVVFGVLSLKSMKSSFFAPIDPHKVRIHVEYPGASAQEVEEGIVLKIEDKLKGIIGVERTSSVSQENNGSLVVEIQKDADHDQVLQSVKNAVDQINTFPAGIEPPIVYRSLITDFAIQFAITGDVPLGQLKRLAKESERYLLDQDTISLVSLSGYPEEEIEISLNLDRLTYYGLTAEDVGNAVRQSSVSVTGGEIQSKQERMQIRYRGKQYTPTGFGNIFLKGDAEGDVIRVRDVAVVRKKWKDNPLRSFFNGNPSILVTVEKSEYEDVLLISKTVNRYIQQMNQRYDDVQFHLVRDGSIVLKQRTRLLVKNGITGFILVFLLLSLVLNMRLAFWVALAIPVSFLGMFIIGNHVDMTINVISLFGMIVVVGILVDDGIIIGENIFQHYERGSSPMTAAVEGTLEVLPSVVSAIITTIIAFMPFYFLDGRIAEIMNNMATVVIFTLLISLIEGALLLPSHLAHSKALLIRREKSRIQRWVSGGLEGVKHRLYQPVLKWSIQNSFIMAMVPIAIMMITVGALKGGVVKSTFFPFVDSDNLTINIKMLPGTHEAITQSVMDRIESHIWAVNTQFKQSREDGLSVIQNVSKIQSSGSHYGTIQISLLDGETRNMESYIINRAIQKAVGEIPIADTIEYASRSFFGKPISISLLSNNLESLVLAKNELKNELLQMEELKNIIDNDQVGARELVISLTPTARLLGVTELDILRQVRESIYGYEVQQFYKDGDETKVWVRLDKEKRHSIKGLESIPIRGKNGQYYQLSSLATISFQRSAAVINHLNGYREIRVEANLSNKKDPVPPILNHILTQKLPPILEKYPDISYSLEGQKRQTKKTSDSAKYVMPLTLFLMYVVIVLGFRSFSQAVLVMLLLPFGAIGMVWGHFVHQMSINLLSIFGFIALMGIIVNDAIVFVNTYNRKIKEGLTVNQAVYESGLSRFRPIVLTSLTTVIGLGPLILEKSRQAQFLIPMAITVAYGLLFATILILVMVPVLLICMNTVRLFCFRLFGYTRKNNATN